MPLLNNKMARYIVVLFFGGGLLYFMYLVRGILFSFLLAALLAYVLFRPVRFFEKKGLKRVWAIMLLYLVILGFFGIALFYAIPVLVKEISDLAILVPGYATQAQNMAQQIEQIEMPIRLSEVIHNNLGRIEDFVYESLNKFLWGFYAFLGKVMAIVFSPILAFYIMNDWEKIRDSFLDWFSPVKRREVTGFFELVDQVLISFFKGHLLVATIVGASVGVMAAVLGVKFPLLIGLGVGITDLIPYFGPILGGIPAVGIALSDSVNKAIYFGVAIVIIQQIEGNILSPKIIGDRLGLHPLIIVFSLLAGGDLLGIWGMLAAVPTAAVLKIIIQLVYRHLIDNPPEKISL